MALYNQQTSLQAQGKFAPGVNYYAGVRAPAQPIPDLPKAQSSFNIDLKSIGDAMIQMSRDKKETELGIARINAVKQEKADEAAQKQLKINMSNAYAQELADVVAQVDQNIIDPIAANRKKRTIDDKYMAYGILSATELGGIAKVYDGGISDYQKNTREQIRKSQIEIEEKDRAEFLEKVPSAIPLSRDQQLLTMYNLKNTDLMIDDALAIATNNPTEANQQMLQTRTNEFANAQGDTVISNYLYANNTISKADLQNNLIQAINAPLMRKQINPQMRAYAISQSLKRYNPMMTEMSTWTEQTAKYLKQSREIDKELFLKRLQEADPLAYAEHLINNTKVHIAPDDKLTNISTDTFAPEYRVKVGGYKLPQTVTTVSSTGTEIVESQKKTDVPVDMVTWLNAKDVSPETISLISSRGSIPTGPFGEANNQLALAGSYNSNVVIPSSTLYNSSTTSGQVATAYENNVGYINRTVNNPVSASNIKAQDAYAGTNYYDALKNQDRSFVYNTLTNDEIRSQADIIHERHAKPFNSKGQYAALVGSLRINPDTGDITLLNNYTKNLGAIDSAAARSTAFNAKESLVAINNFTSKVYPDDAQKRAQFARSFFDGVVQIPYYTFGEGGASVKPTTGEKVIDSALDFATAGAQVGTKAINKIYQSYKGIEEKTEKYMKQNFEPEYQKALKVDPTLTRLKFLTDKAVQYIADEIYSYMNSSADNKQTVEKEEPSVFNKLLDKSIKGLENFTKYVNESVEGNNIDFQMGTIDFREPNALPIVTNDDGSWSNIKFGTIGADGRTYIVPSIAEDGKPSTVEEEFDKGRTLGSVAGEDETAVARAEYMGQKIRQYLIDRDTPKAESSIDEVKNLSSISGGGVQEITDKIKNNKNISSPKRKSMLEKIVEVNDAFGEGAFEGMKDFFKGWGEEIEENLLPVGKMLAYNAIAEEYGYIDAQQMLEDTDTGLRGQLLIPSTMMTARKVYKVLDWIANEAPDIKPITWLKKLFKKDEAKMLDAAAAVFIGGNASKREKERFIRSYKTWKEQNSEADTAYYQNFSGIY